MNTIFLILLSFISAVRCSWLCDSIGLDCVTQTAVKLYPLVPSTDGWQNIEVEYVTVSAFSLVHCTTLSVMGGFTGAIYLPVKGSCYLLGRASLPTMNAFDRTVLKNPDLVQLQNVALGKTTYSTNPWSGAYASSNAVDGDHNKFYTSAWTVKSWWLVDLGAAYDIFDIKLVHRQDGYGLPRFAGVEVRGGNTLITGPDLTAYDLIGTVDVLPHNFKIWFVMIPPPNSPPYQFVSIQLVRTYGAMHLGLGEVYINSIV